LASGADSFRPIGVLALVIRSSRFHAVILAVALSACAGPHVNRDIGRKDLLDFLSDGVTRREDVMLKLGEPSAQYEASRILTYRLGKDDTGYFPASGPRSDWSATPYSLVLVFDSAGVLARHSLVGVHVPK